MAFKNNYFQKFTNEGVPFMDSRDAGDINTILDMKLKIKDFGFINDRSVELGKYAVFIVEGIDDKFFFGGSVISDVLNTIYEDGMKDALCSGDQEVMIKKKQGKKTKRDYHFIEFI